MNKLLLENYLLVLKSTVEVYIHGTLESSNKKVRDTLKEGLDETLKHQNNTYNKMTEHGFYKVNNIKLQEINKTLNKLKKC
ncbi:MAG: spore coat protein [Bacilli bacterium]|nr:spore coat protein [Bacilli bacterium]